MSIFVIWGLLTNAIKARDLLQIKLIQDMTWMSTCLESWNLSNTRRLNEEYWIDRRLFLNSSGVGVLIPRHYLSIATFLSNPVCQTETRWRSSLRYAIMRQLISSLAQLTIVYHHPWSLLDPPAPAANLSANSLKLPPSRTIWKLKNL